MKNETLLIPDKPDIERDSIAYIWMNNGGTVVRIGKFWEKPNIETHRVCIYGNDTFSLVLAQVIGVKLLTVKDDWIVHFNIKWTKRQLEIKTILEITPSLFPLFIKPVKPKTFTSKVYTSIYDFKKETKGIDDAEKIILSGIIEIEAEIRAFILNNEILDAAVYEGSADVNQAKEFLNQFLSQSMVSLPHTFVIDLGFNSTNGWFVIELNSSWGAGLNSCDPQKVISGIREATIN